MRRYWLVLMVSLLSLIAVACGGCGSSDGGGGGGGALAKVSIVADGLADGSLACPKGKAVALTLAGSTDSGAPVDLDPSKVTWESDGPAFVVNGSAVTATADLFDSGGGEPQATLTARYGDKSASVRLAGVIDASGSWTATLDTGTSVKLSLSQSGRALTDANTHITGTIQGNALSFNASGFQIDAKFVSRDEADGTYSGSGAHGTLVCKRTP